MTSWRSDVRDNYKVTLDAFQAANPTLVDNVNRARPPSVVETRTVFVGLISEPDIALDSGTWRRIAEVDIVAAVHLADNEETTDKLDELADELTDWLAANDRAHVLGAHTEQHPIRSTPVEIIEGAVIIPAIAITCRATIQQGRS
jgi:hypothetical protein